MAFSCSSPKTRSRPTRRPTRTDRTAGIGRRIAAAALALALIPGAAVASACHSFVQSVPGVQVARLDLPAPVATDAPGAEPLSVGPRVASAAGDIAITYVGHSTYRIETAGGVIAATDYNGRHGQSRVPDVVTMNNAHSTHFTDYPDPAITHVLRGWNPTGEGPAVHFVEIGDMIVRNVTTDIRSGYAGRKSDGNSIFVFEIGEICIGHLGHLHHTLSDAHYNQLGRIDVLMAPVDGTWTLSIADMVSVAKRLKSRVVLPMHAFGAGSLKLFLDGMRDEFAIQVRDERTMRLAQGGLPETPTVIVLGSSRLRGWD